MPDLLIASENPGKLVEIRAILQGMPIRLVSPGDLGLRLDVAETGQTYAENAGLKARAYAQAGRMAALGDDSGLEVAALDGGPGLYSHRFSPKPHASDADRRAYLLEQLAGKPVPPGMAGWPAAFRCTVAVATPEGDLRFAEGTCPGVIIPDERGMGGFGYDPIFYLPELGQTMAELDMEVKNRVSHRGRAVLAAEPILREIFHLGAG
jgi:XTP/dITP diphosphohydrolase